jgi:hypothetical protein
MTAAREGAVIKLSCIKWKSIDSITFSPLFLRYPPLRGLRESQRWSTLWRKGKRLLLPVNKPLSSSLYRGTTRLRPSLILYIIIIIIIIITLYTRRRHLHVLFLLNIYLSISVFSVTPVTGSQSLFAIVAGLLLLQVLNSSVSSLFPLPFPTSFRVFIIFFFFLPATRSLFA